MTNPIKGIDYVCATPIETAQTLLKLAEAKEQEALQRAIKALETSMILIEKVRVELMEGH